MSEIKIPASYFEPEVRDNFEISELMKRAWAAEQEVLKIIIDICERNDIKYFLFYGSLLGAVRHKGFIPWDDDIDIALLRPDYDRLIEALHRELPDGFVVAGAYAAEKRLFEACKTAQCRVIADEQYWTFPRYLDRFHCFPYPRIGIDIFPFDFVYANEDEYKEHMELGREITILVDNFETLSKKSRFPQEIRNLNKKYGVDFEINDELEQRLWQLLDNLCTICPEEEAGGVTYVASMFRGNRYKFDKEWFADTKIVPFDMIETRIPAEYDKALRAIYGDYTVPRQGWAAHDYPFYATQEEAMLKLFKESGIDNDVTTFCHNWYNLTHKND